MLKLKFLFIVLKIFYLGLEINNKVIVIINEEFLDL